MTRCINFFLKFTFFFIESAFGLMLTRICQPFVRWQRSKTTVSFKNLQINVLGKFGIEPAFHTKETRWVRYRLYNVTLFLYWIVGWNDINCWWWRRNDIWCFDMCVILGFVPLLNVVLPNCNKTILNDMKMLFWLFPCSLGLECSTENKRENLRSVLSRLARQVIDILEIKDNPMWCDDGLAMHHICI